MLRRTLSTPQSGSKCYQNMHIYLHSRALSHVKWPEYPAEAFAKERGTRESDAAGFIPIHGVEVIISLPPYRT